MNHALRKTLGDHVEQRGSLVDHERLRFDFSHDKSLSADEVERIERIVNELIVANVGVQAITTPLADAKQIKGVRAAFGEKYPDPVRVVAVSEGDVAALNALDASVEFCGGTHAFRTGDIGFFKIIAEESLSKGIRRITAVTGVAASGYVRHLEGVTREIAKQLSVPIDDAPKRIAAMQDEIKTLKKKLASGSAGPSLAGAASKAAELMTTAIVSGATTIVVARIDGASSDYLAEVMDAVKAASPSFALLLASVEEEEKITFLASVSADVIPRGLKAGDWIRDVAKATGGGAAASRTSRRRAARSRRSSMRRSRPRATSRRQNSRDEQNTPTAVRSDRTLDDGDREPRALGETHARPLDLPDDHARGFLAHGEATTLPTTPPTTSPATRHATSRRSTSHPTTRLAGFPTPSDLFKQMAAAKAETKAKAQVAVIDVSGGFDERAAAPSLSLLGGGSNPTFRDLVERIQRSGDDASVRAVLFTTGEGTSMNLAQVQELRGEIAKLRKTKRIFVYGDAYDTQSYLLASAATDVCMLGAGEIFIPGISIETQFYKGVLDKFGVKADYVQIGEFKGAEEPYTRSEPSPELRGELDRLTKSLMDQVVDGIGESRNLSAEKVRALIDEAMLPPSGRSRRGWSITLSISTGFAIC